jgi:hypothetical protein
MSLFVAKVTLNVNGTEIEDFKSFTEDPVLPFKPVSLMNKTGHLRMQKRYTGKVEYMPPSDVSEFDWDTVQNARLTVTYEGTVGRKTTWTGVYITDTGTRKSDGENETVQELTWSAEDKILEVS